MTRAFFDQIDDEVRGMVGPALRNFNSERSGRLIKIWYADPAVHFEVQCLSATWAPNGKPCLEIGLHLESREPERNEQTLNRLAEDRDAWAYDLQGAGMGNAFGPMSGKWRRLSEVVDLVAMDGDFAGEVAERFAGYIRTLYPLLGEGLPAGRGPKDRL